MTLEGLYILAVSVTTCLTVAIGIWVSDWICDRMHDDR